VAKIELNLPDDLLHQLDRVAERVGETRDEFLARIAAQEVDRID
jgi:metal-responsive CopG/Arc/MetJ family transcriptional regulator